MGSHPFQKRTLIYRTDRYADAEACPGVLRAASVILTLLLIAVALPVQRASAGHQYLHWNPSGDAQVTFAGNSAITIYQGAIEFDDECPEGGLKDELFPFADVYVIEGAGVQRGSPLDDISGSPNTISGASGGLFIEETIGLTEPFGNIGPGTYSVIYDECQNGVVDGSDKVFSGAFSVEITGGVPPFPEGFAHLKLKAKAQRNHWYEVLIGYRYLFFLDDLVKLRSIPTILRGDDPLGLFKTLLTEFPKQVFGLDPKRAAITSILNTARHYEGIYADPPDAQFAQVTELGAQEPITQSDDEFITAIIESADAAAVESSLAGGLLASVERYQGAALARDTAWALIHARAARDHARTLAQQLSRTIALLDEADAALIADDRPFDELSAAYQQLQDRVATSGFSDEEVRQVRNVGLDAEQLVGLEGDIVANGAVYTEAALRANVAQLQTTSANLASELMIFADDMQTTVEALETDDSVADEAPQTSAGGPYTGIEGSPITFDGTGSVGPSPVVSYKWDLDGDGSFDDASGPTPSFTYSRAFEGLVGLRAEGANGRQSVGYATIAISDVNRRPSIDTFTPADPLPEIVVGDSQSFDVTTADPDGEPVTVEWSVDGTAVATGATLEFAPTAQDLGLRTIEAAATDSSPLGGLTRARIVVAVVRPDRDSDGWRANVDCDDTDPTVNPGATEIRGNGRDDDCDLLTSDVRPSPADTSFDSVYEAAWGVMPDEMCGPWTLIDTAAPEDPYLSGDNLVMETSENPEALYYIQQGTELTMPETLVIEARMRYVSGSSSAATRSPAVIGFTTAPRIGNGLFIGADEIFINSDNEHRGARATVDTDGISHTYRVEVTTATGEVRVFYDGVFLLSGSTFFSEGGNSADQVVFFGDATCCAQGASEWAFVRHNAKSVQCLNLPPTATDDSFVGDMDSKTTIPVGDLLANDADPDGGSLTVTEVGAGSATHGSVEMTGDTITYNPEPGYHGPALFAYTIRNEMGRVATAAVNLTVRQVNHEPFCSVVAASPAVLWPPNHKFQTVSLEGAIDPDGDAVTTTIVKVAQDELLNGLGDGDTSPDAEQTASPTAVRLRAERSGAGDGRVYRVTFRIVDGRGGSCIGTVRVGVPKSQGATGSPAIESDFSVNSFGT